MERSVISLFLFFTIQSSLAQMPGELDIQFGQDGITTVDAEGLGRDDGCNFIRQLTNGKLIVCGRHRTTGFPPYESDFLLAQFNLDGSLDLNFGQNGFAITDLGGESESLAKVFEHDGKILSVGTSDQSGSFEHAILEYELSGNLNTSFGNGGVEYNQPLGNSSTLSDAMIDADDNLIATGGSSVSGVGVLLSKYGQNGTPITSFGVSGSVSHDLGLIESTSELEIQDDGKIVLAGYQAASGNPEDVLICRLNADGSLDGSFNSNGWVNLALSPNIDRANDIAIDGNGRIVVVGFTTNLAETGFEAFAARLLTDGNYDNTFGSNGVVYLDIGDGNDMASSLVLQPDGKIIIGGSSNDGNDDNFCLIRLNEDGSLDPTFGNNGIVITEISVGYDAIADMELQADGKLVVGGTARVGSNDDIVLARYHTGLNISVDEIDEKSLFSVYPNPVSNLLTIKAESKLEDVELLDALGRTVLSQQISTIRTQLDISHLPSGIYLLQAKDGKTLFSQRVVKE